jgi:hypothetical protein
MTAKRRDGWNVPSRFVSRYLPAMISFNTVQELIDGGYKLHAYWHNSRCQVRGIGTITRCKEPASVSRAGPRPLMQRTVTLRSPHGTDR